MTSANSEAGSKSKRPKLRLIAALSVLILAAAFVAGPTVFLHILLNSMFPPESGLSLSYGRARAGLLFTSLSVSDITVQGLEPGAGLPVLSIKSLRLDGVSGKNLIKYFRRGETPLDAPLFLAAEADIDDIELKSPLFQAALAKAGLRRLTAAPENPGEPPFRFDRFEARRLRYGLLGPGASESLTIEHLEARNLGPDVLGGLSVKQVALSHKESGPGGDVDLGGSLGGLTLGGLKLGIMRQAARSDDAVQIAWWLLTGCDALDLAQLSFSVDQVEALAVRSAVFDSIAQGPRVNYIRRLDFSLNPAFAAEKSRSPFWRDLADIVGPELTGEIALDLDYAAVSGETVFKSVRLAAEDLGRLELSGRLTGVSTARARHSPYQILYGANTWRLENLSLDFTNSGLAKAVYAHLDRSVFWDRPPGRTAAGLMAEYVRPVAGRLEREGGLANLPSVVDEIESFLNRPEHLRLVSAPKPPLTMVALNLTGPASLANIDKYDIIEKLNLTLEVNQRAPLAVAVASGLFEERMPAGPRPMNNHFERRDAPAEQDNLSDSSPLQGLPDIRDYPHPE